MRRKLKHWPWICSRIGSTSGSRSGPLTKAPRVQVCVNKLWIDAGARQKTLKPFSQWTPQIVVLFRLFHQTNTGSLKFPAAGNHDPILPRFNNWICKCSHNQKRNYVSQHCDCFQCGRLLTGHSSHGRIHWLRGKVVREIHLFILRSRIHAGLVWRSSPVSVVDAMWKSWIFQSFTSSGLLRPCLCTMCVRTTSGTGCIWDSASTATS